MKKIYLLLLTLFLFACSPVLKGIGKYEFEDRNGEKQEVSVVIEMKDDKISSISIDETYTQDGERTTKKRLGASYGMKEVEGSKGEWNEQIKHLEMELIGTDGEIDLNDAVRFIAAKFGIMKIMNLTIDHQQMKILQVDVQSTYLISKKGSKMQYQMLENKNTKIQD